MWQPYENEKGSQSINIGLGPAYERHVDPMAEVLLGLQSQQPPNISANLDFAPDDALFNDLSFEGIPDYFWGAWGLN